MNTKHTPGPWAAPYPSDGYGMRHPPNVSDHGHVATTSWQGDEDHTDANARLIAAAPSLADALRWALEQIEDSLDPDHQAALAEAWATLNRATGE